MDFGPAHSDQLPQRLRVDQRHVAVQHQHQRIVGDLRHGLHERVTGAQLLGLQRPLQVRVVEGGAYLLAAVTVHHVDGRGLEQPCAANNMPQQRPAGERLQYLGESGFHSLALTGSENDDGELHGPGSIAGAGVDAGLRSAAEVSARGVVGVFARGVVGGEIVLAEQRIHDAALRGLRGFRLRLARGPARLVRHGAPRARSSRCGFRFPGSWVANIRARYLQGDVCRRLAEAVRRARTARPALATVRLQQTGGSC